MRAEQQVEQRFVNVERRVDRIEQILPTLVTKDDLRTHVSREIAASEARMRAHVSDGIAASEARMRAHVSEEIAASEQRTRTHFDVVAEGLQHHIRLVAESVAALSESVAVLSERLR